jgi:regulator of sigma E protease
LHRGDLVLRVNDQSIEDAAQLRALIRRSVLSWESSPQVWKISRNQELHEIAVTPVRVHEGASDVGRVGAQIGQAPTQVWIQFESVSAWLHAFDQTRVNVKLTIMMTLHVLMGQVGWDQLGGPLMIADYAGRTVQIGLGVYLGYLAMLSVSLGVFNLLPIPALDGGHLLYYLYEFVTGKSLSEQWLGILQRLGFALLLTVMIFSFLNDAARMGWLG